MSDAKLNHDANKIFRPQPFKWKRYTAVAVGFFILAFIIVVFPKSDKEPSFHAEIFPSNAISYIKDNKLFALANGDYNLAMPEGGTFVNGVAPMLLVEVDGEYYPLNIADDSILPRQGRQLPLKILFGFTSPHASNTLHYDEKKGGDPVRDFRRKVSYYLHVDNGYGQVERKYRIVTH
ncbi:MAG: hypothetical protein IKZ58_06035 [Selenomonadaceae bacterium]|nr:hypothetical protein [Selenomonadaceae bacterium]